MKTRTKIAIGIFALLLALAFVYRQSIVLRITGVRPFVAERFDGWVEGGADEAELDAALRRIHDPVGSGPGSWVYELSQPAARYRASAQEAETAASPETASKLYHTAAVWYYIARFPFVGSPARAEAYRNHIDCYLEAVARQTPPLEIVRIPFEGEEIIGYLRLPTGIERPPVVVMTGGVDTWKSDIERQVQAMLAEGMAAFAFDMPGTGESAWPLGANESRVYSRVFEYLKARPDVDGDRIGAYLMSFAGYYAVKLAVTDPNLKAVVNVGGPIHLSFTLEHARTMPAMMIKTIAHAKREDMDQPLEQMVEKIEAMSLQRLGLLEPPARQAALLSINGDRDPLVAIDDLYLISQSGIAQEEWVYPGDGHCASANAGKHIPRAAAWLKARLTGV
jgi:esterase FrsA